MGIGTLRCAVIDVDDLDVAEALWSEVTGLDVIGRKWTGRFSYLGHSDPWKHEIILQLVAEPKGNRPNRAHIDITPEIDIDDAIPRIESIGGRVKKPPSLYPRPGSHSGTPPLIDWAVMQDPFGNEFCLVHELSEEQTAAALEVPADGDIDDQVWRAAAGQVHS